MLFKFIAQKQMSPLRLMLLLGFTGLGWLATDAIAPQIAQAYTASVNVSISRQLGETYEGFLRRAEAIARAATQRSFDRDILVTDVAVTVIGQNQGAVTPILLLEVSRQSWRSRPDPQRWTTYFPDTQSLLGFEEPAVDTATQSPAGEPPPPPGAPGAPGTPGAPASVPPPAQPTVIDIPGAPIRIIPSPSNQAPSAPAGTSAPSSPPTIPEIPGAPIRRIPNPTAAPAPSTPTTQPTTGQ